MKNQNSPKEKLQKFHRSPWQCSHSTDHELYLTQVRGQSWHETQGGRKGKRSRDKEWLKMARCKEKTGFSPGGGYGYALVKERRGSCSGDSKARHRGR